jgi:copper(I)-binding protein
MPCGKNFTGMEIMSKRLLLSIVALLCAAQAVAGEVAVNSAWVRATAPGQDSAAVSLVITSQKNARLVAVSSPASASAEMHSMKHENGMMMMRAVEALPLPAKHEVILGAGDHIMLTGLKQALKAGESVALTLTVEFADKRKEEVTVKAEVRPLTAGHKMHDMPGM